MRDAAIFDLDGTLCDTSGVVHLLETEGGFAAFQAAAVGCPPNPDVVRAARQAAADGLAVLVVTSREFVWHDVTLDWLVEHEIPHENVRMRIVGDYRKDVAVKADMLTGLVSDGYRVVAAWDDKPAVLDLWREHGIEVHPVGC
ncbi:hypothetical protein HMPREF0063_11184 [Aeromicrobium marinum DSM 15272]|uniref:Polynucleotide kinase PNKP phosphatase domain-containing protein n=1 Tax=Aeromicrobium marinum DSM 15272 TaxID=585531 RepID=E2SAX6_9ACTN|nr:hypothetical protein [Aeromicrobium marinum]EFQ83522.1 hypothetical protein HMPREF0063_11184 [Aeromicrobium marinum DSM 15272]